jgi:hypothetical protein
MQPVKPISKPLAFLQGYQQPKALKADPVKAAFLQGYLQKTAALGLYPLARDATNTVVSKAAVVAAIAPVLLGIAAGYGVSRLTSPPEKAKLQQKRMVAHELNETLHELERRRDLETAEATQSKVTAPFGSRGLRLL